jgi:hypothetical protein
LKLSDTDPESLRRRYHIVRRDTFETIAGLIIHADEMTGVFRLQRKGPDGTFTETDYSMGADGIRIVTNR